MLTFANVTFNWQNKIFSTFDEHDVPISWVDPNKLPRDEQYMDDQVET